MTGLSGNRPKPASANLTVNITENVNLEFINDVHLHDFTHAAVVSNSREIEGGNLEN